MRALFIAVFFFLSLPAFAETLVGGPCTYDEYPGTCTVTGADAEGNSLFTFEGSVNGERVGLADNAANEPKATGTTSDCTLKFITTGTCTPCLLSIGSCGKEAWDAFRNASAAKNVEVDPQSSGAGCSFVVLR
jgi:hypothetical protein